MNQNTMPEITREIWIHCDSGEHYVLEFRDETAIAAAPIRGNDFRAVVDGFETVAGLADIIVEHDDEYDLAEQAMDLGQRQAEEGRYVDWNIRVTIDPEGLFAPSGPEGEDVEASAEQFRNLLYDALAERYPGADIYLPYAGRAYDGRNEDCITDADGYSDEWMEHELYDIYEHTWIDRSAEWIVLRNPSDAEQDDEE